MSIASGVLLLSDFGLWDGRNKRLGVWGEENWGGIYHVCYIALGDSSASCSLLACIYVYTVSITISDRLVHVKPLGLPGTYDN